MNLIYAENVIKTPAITRCVGLIDPYFDGEPSIITSGLRSEAKQLQIIIDKAHRRKIENDFVEFNNNLGNSSQVACFVEGYPKAIFWWQRTWSKLLEMQDIVNPPIAAECLSNYVDGGVNKKGVIIGISPHMKGLSFDIAGGNSTTEKAKRVMKASQSGDCFVHSFRIEPNNLPPAIHVDTVQIG